MLLLRHGFRGNIGGRELALLQAVLGSSNTALDALAATLQREMAAQFATVIEFAFYLEPAFMPQQHVFDDGEPHAGNKQHSDALQFGPPGLINIQSLIEKR